MSRTATRLFASLALLSFGCSSSDLGFHPPADVAWVGLVRTDGEPSTAEPPGLVPVDGAELAAQIELTDAADAPWQAVGYRAADLEGLALPSATILAATPLARVDADACWTLRAPAWSEAVTDAARTAPPSLVSVPWARHCPASTERRYDVRCAGPHLLCGLNTAQGGDCIDTVDTTLCPGEMPRVAIERDGSACLLAEPTAGCTRATNPQGGPRWTCGACTFDGYPPLAPPAVEIHTATVAAPFEPPLRPGVLPPSVLVAGPVRALAVRGDRVWLATAPPHAMFSGFCVGDTTLHDIDPETLASRARTPWPGCLSAMVSDPTGDGFLVATYRSDALILARIDDAGTTVMTTTVTRPASAERAAAAGRVQLAIAGQRVLLAELLTVDGFEVTSLIHTLDLTDFHPLAPARPVSDLLTSLAVVRDDTLLISRNDGVNLVPLDVPQIPAANQLFSKSELHSPQVLSARRVLLIDSGGVGGVVDVDVQRAVPTFPRGARVFERTALITAVEPIEGAAGPPLATAAMSLDGGRKWAAALVSLDASDDLRVLPGLRPIEHAGAPVSGPVMALQRDARGRLWGAATWAGLLVRIDRL